jgi:lauroyl/myristoyl acyltransferase
MAHSTYTISRDQLVNNYKSSLNISEDENLTGQLNLVSAGLVNYLPEIAIGQHEDIYKGILLHKKLSILEQSDYEVLDHVTMENLNPEIVDQLKNKPTVICTFHTGSYRLLNLFLTSNKIPYTLVIGNDIVQQEGSLFESQYSNLPGSEAADGGFRIINAEAPNVGLQMLRELKRGRSLLLYMDGNTGAGAATTKNDNRCSINFLQQQLYARKGIAFLAHTAGVPIVTVASYRKTWADIRLKFFDMILPDAQLERTFFAEKVTQQIYDLVAPIIKAYPEQWEAWLYIHKVAHICRPLSSVYQRKDVCVGAEKISFDSFQFGIFKVKGSPFLLRKNTYSFYEINNQLYDFLSGCKEAPVKKDCIEESLFNKLYEQGVISYV